MDREERHIYCVDTYYRHQGDQQRGQRHGVSAIECSSTVHPPPLEGREQAQFDSGYRNRRCMDILFFL